MIGWLRGIRVLVAAMMVGGFVAWLGRRAVEQSSQRQQHDCRSGEHCDNPAVIVLTLASSGSETSARILIKSGLGDPLLFSIHSLPTI